VPLDPVIAKIVAIVDTHVAGGAHWGNKGEEIAHIAVKRWNSYAKRRPKAKRIRNSERVADLAKGFKVHFESGQKPWNIPDGEWSWLAECLVPVLREFGS
jgi:hypothetical protein